MGIGFKGFVLSTVVATAVGFGVQAKAQEAAAPTTPETAAPEAAAAPVVREGGIEEIVVTAQKRAERSQDVPIALTAFTAQTIEQYGFENALEAATQTPNFRVGGLAGSSNTVAPILNIRGIQFTDASSFVNDPSVSLYVDEVYQAAIGAGVQQMFDVERVEVLKGPQGSLFGRNSSAGLIQVVTKKPTDTFEGYASATYGEYNKRGVEGAISGPLAEGVRGRVAAKWLANDGYRENPISGNDSFGETNAYFVRGTLEADVADDFLITASAHYSNGDNTFPGRDYRGTRVPGNTTVRCAPVDVREGRCSTRLDFFNRSDDPTVTYSIRANPTTFEAYGASLRGDLTVGSIDFVSITGIERWSSYILQDTGFGPYSVNNITSDFTVETNNWSQELRASGSNGPTNWVLGAFYYEDQRSNVSNIYDWWARISPVPITPSGPTQGRESGVDTTSAALFGHIETELAEDWTLSIGGRYSNEHRDMVRQRFWSTCAVNACAPTLNGTGKGEFSNFSGDLTLRWKPTENSMTYAKYARGFKSGGWNPSAATTALAGPADPEIVDTWEVGLKSDWFDRRLRTNIALFHSNFDGLQSTLVQIVGGAPVSNFVNAGKATVTGSEWEITAVPIENLELKLGVGTLDAEITEVAPGGTGITVGNRLPNAADLSTSGSARYTFNLGEIGSLAFQGEFNGTSELFFTVDNDPYRFQPEYTLYNARIMWDSADGKYNAQLSVENLTNERYATGAFQTASYDVMYFEYGMPRFVTLKIGAKF